MITSGIYTPNPFISETRFIVRFEREEIRVFDSKGIEIGVIVSIPGREEEFKQFKRKWVEVFP